MAVFCTRLTQALLVAAFLLPVGPTCAQEGWLAQELARLSALSHTLQAVSGNAWLQIPVQDQRIHGIPEETYRNDARPLLDALAASVRPDLERELDGILNGLRYEDLRVTSARQPLSYCSWIGAARSDGMLPSASDLQATLSARCRTVAAGVVTRLLDQHADSLDLTLPGLPRLELGFPAWLLADLAEPDTTGSSAVNPVRLQAAYQDRLARRIAAATPTLRTDLDSAYAARTWHRGPIASPETDCRFQLGPLATGNLGSTCRDAATRWIASLLPVMTAALPGAVTAALTVRPALDEDGLCHAVLSPWLPDSLPGTIQAAASAACLPVARHAVSQAAADRAQALTDAIAARVTRLAAPNLAVRPTYDSLLAQAWFGQPPSSWDAIVPASDPDTPAIRQRAQADYARLIAPATEVALADARQRIDRAYARAAGSTAAIRDTQHLCGANGRGAGLPPAPTSPSLRDQIVSTCAKAFETFQAARARIALDRAGIRPDDKTLLIVVADGDASLLLRDLITRAAAVGLQVRTIAGTLGFGARLIVTPIGADSPVLSGSVSRSSQGLVLSAIDAFPGWPADTLDTVLCVTSTEEDLVSIQFSALLTLFGGVIAADADRPRTAGALMRDGLSQLQTVQSRRACAVARQTFVDQATGG